MSASATEPGADLPRLAMRLTDTEMVDVARLTPARQQQVGIIAASVPAPDSSAVASFGAGPQRKLSGLLDRLLAASRAVDGVGASLAELAARLGALNLPAVSREVAGKAPLLTRLPIANRYFSALRRLRAGQAATLDQLAGIGRTMAAQLAASKVEAAGLDRVLDATEQTIRECETWVAGGQQALLRLRAAFAAERDALQHAAGLRDAAERIDAFEARLLRNGAVVAAGAAALPPIRTALHAGPAGNQAAMTAILPALPALTAALVHVAAPGRSGLAERVATLDAITGPLLATVASSAAAGGENRARLDEAAQQLDTLRTAVLTALRTQADTVRLS